MSAGDIAAGGARIRHSGAIMAAALSVLLCASAAEAGTIRYVFSDFSAKRWWEVTPAIGPQIAGHIDFYAEQYLSPEGIDIPSFFQHGYPPMDWAALGVRALLFDFAGWTGPNAITLADLVPLQDPSGTNALLWGLQLRIPGGPDDASNPTKPLAHFALYLSDARLPSGDFILFGGDHEGRVSGDHATASGGPCMVDPNAGLWGCSVAGRISGPYAVVPEPGTLALLGMGLLGLAAARRWINPAAG